MDSVNPLQYQTPEEIDQVKALSDALIFYGWEVSVGEVIEGYVELMAIDRRNTKNVRHVKYADDEFTLFRAMFYLAKACGVNEPEQHLAS